MNTMQKKNIGNQEQFHTTTMENMSIKLTQTKALLLIGSDIDFSTYHPSVQQDYFGAALQYVEDISDILEESADSTR